MVSKHGGGMDSPTRWTAPEAEAAPDTVEYVTEAEFDADVAASSVADLIAAIEADELDRDEVIAAERRGKQRKGILALAPDTEE